MTTITDATDDVLRVPLNGSRPKLRLLRQAVEELTDSDAAAAIDDLLEPPEAGIG